MKKLTYVGLALMLSFAIGGSSAAQDNLETAGQAAADIGISQSGPAVDPSGQGSEDILLAQSDDPCLPYGTSLCEWIESVCCDSSPFEVNELFCKKNWTRGMCGECYHSCGN
jgi:hypothetical protein